MSNNELTIDQELTSEVLKEIAGGPHITTWWTFKAIIHPDFNPRRLSTNYTEVEWT